QPPARSLQRSAPAAMRLRNKPVHSCRSIGEMIEKGVELGFRRLLFGDITPLNPQANHLPVENANRRCPPGEYRNRLLRRCLFLAGNLVAEDRRRPCRCTLPAGRRFSLNTSFSAFPKREDRSEVLDPISFFAL